MVKLLGWKTWRRVWDLNSRNFCRTRSSEDPTPKWPWLSGNALLFLNILIFFASSLWKIQPFHMRCHFFLHYGWFFQNLGKEAVRTFMHTTVNIQSWIYQLGIPWWSEWLEISTHEGVLDQSNLIDDNGISPDKLRDEYVMGLPGQLGPEVVPE